ncbi:hypothetical protein RRG08_061197 [Elysia crispata]|uniref:Uncharacterized protein n=1 Tax=Elysia crispata TaxID=231223 RepID=A0AAE0ZMW1_9GAST|nr:hypothetical protein RRG08_061197 [Elysia crispata]
MARKAVEPALLRHTLSCRVYDDFTMPSIKVLRSCRTHDLSVPTSPQTRLFTDHLKTKHHNHRARSELGSTVLEFC